MLSSFNKKLEKYSDYMQASREFEAILGLIQTYKLDNEYNNFIKNTSSKLYVSYY